MHTASVFGTEGCLFSRVVDFAPVRDPRHTDELRRVVDDIHHAPVTYPNAPLVFLAFQLLAPCGTWRATERFEFTHHTGQHVVRQRFEFLPCGGLYLDEITTHVGDRV